MIQQLLLLDSSSRHDSRRTLLSYLFLFTSIWCAVASSSHPESKLQIHSLAKLKQTTDPNNDITATNITGMEVIETNDDLQMDENNILDPAAVREDRFLVVRDKARTNTATLQQTLKRNLHSNIFNHNNITNNKETDTEEIITPEAGDNPLNQTDPLITNITVTNPTNASQSSIVDPNDNAPTSSPTVEKICDASSCDGCKSLSGTARIQNKEKACVWDDNDGCMELRIRDHNHPNIFDFTCEEIGVLPPDPELMGAAASENEQKSDDNKDDNSENEDPDKERKDGATIAVVFVVFILLGGFVIRKVILHRSNRTIQNTNSNSTSDIYESSRGLSGRPNSEA